MGAALAASLLAVNGCSKGKGASSGAVAVVNEVPISQDEYYGLYANVEAMDSKWVKHNYEEDGGDLWQGLDSADFSQAGVKCLKAGG